MYVRKEVCIEKSNNIQRKHKSKFLHYFNGMFCRAKVITIWFVVLTSHITVEIDDFLHVLDFIDFRTTYKPTYRFLIQD